MFLTHDNVANITTFLREDLIAARYGAVNPLNIKNMINNTLLIQIPFDICSCSSHHPSPPQGADEAAYKTSVSIPAFLNR